MILNEIAQYKYREVEAQKEAVPQSELKSALADCPPTRDFHAAIRRPDSFPVRVIAEVKKASPSKGVIREDFEPVEIARCYEMNGASAISVLTDEKFFQGSADYLADVKAAVALPVLRKDFIIDEYQIFQSRAMGADAILLVAALLTEDELKRYLSIAGELGLHSLVEVHDEAETDVALAAGVHLIGVNNRDLKTFHVDLSTSLRLARRVPSDVVLVSESGISSYVEVRVLADKGVHAVLIGETFMRASDIGAKIREFTKP